MAGMRYAGTAALVVLGPAIIGCAVPATDQAKKSETEARVEAVVVEILGLNPTVHLTLQSRFNEDLGADSLDCVEIVMAIEEKFGITIADDDVPSLKTVGDAVSYVERRRQ